MTSDRWSEMAAAYVAGALTESERTAMEERLETDEELRRLVAAYRGSLDDALERLPDRSPPPELRARVLARAREEAGSGDGLHPLDRNGAPRPPRGHAALAGPGRLGRRAALARHAEPFSPVLAGERPDRAGGDGGPSRRGARRAPVRRG